MVSQALFDFGSRFYLPPRLPLDRSDDDPWGDGWFPNSLEKNDESPQTGCCPLTTFRELIMLRVMDTITDKANWDVKVFDDAITAKWRQELLDSDAGVTEKMMDWIIKELKDKAKLFKKNGGLVTAYDGDVVKSDVAVPESLKLALRAAAARLEDVPDEEKDWHPGSNDQVLDLVHPSLFPLLYGKSRIVLDKPLTIDEGISRTGEGETIPEVGPKKKARSQNRSWIPQVTEQWSDHFQWLPCEVAFKPTGDGESDFRCEINSYINNLHPQDHPGLYDLIGEVITRTIPLWNKTLTPLLNTESRNLRIVFDGVSVSPNPDEIPEDEQPQQEDDENDDAFWDRKWYWEQDFCKRNLVLPEPGDYEPRPQPDNLVDLRKEYAKNGLQVIVKLANIHLTPEKPEYGGGTWHVEGQLNERICATALYYYDSENITESRLAFRHRCSSEETIDINYEQNHRYWLLEVFGAEDGDPAIQDIGSVACKEGRLLTFPNIFQHQVQPFRLLDPTKPGHRKILALFLVDPNARILSTANVPAQRRDWWMRQVPWQRILRPLPLELKNMVEEQVDDFPISMEEAKEIRKRLMEERKAYVVENNREWAMTTFSLCEH